MFPPVVPKWQCTTPCVVEFYAEGVDEDGAQIKTEKKKLKCNYQNKAYRVYNGETMQTVVQGECDFYGDPCPEITVPSGGKIEILGHVFEIEVQKNYDPHNPLRPDDIPPVNYTRCIIK